MIDILDDVVSVDEFISESYSETDEIDLETIADLARYGIVYYD